MILTKAQSAAIDWRGIDAVPDDRKDGRDVLLWAGYPAVVSWCDGWRDAVGGLVAGATHWADVLGPVS